MKFIKQTLRNAYVNNIGEPDQEKGNILSYYWQRLTLIKVTVSGKSSYDDNPFLCLIKL